MRPKIAALGPTSTSEHMLSGQRFNGNVRYLQMSPEHAIFPIQNYLEEFDPVSHLKFLEVLKDIGIRGISYNSKEVYLRRRKQCVRIEIN